MVGQKVVSMTTTTSNQDHGIHKHRRRVPIRQGIKGKIETIGEDHGENQIRLILV